MSSASDSKTKKPGTPDADPLKFDQLNLLQQLIALIFMPMVIKDDGTDDAKNDLFSSLLGFDNVDDYKQWHDDARKPGTSTQDVIHNFDYSHSDFSGMGKTAADNAPPSGNSNFDAAMKVVLRNEGGLNMHEPDGAIANFGINSKANPDIDVKNLTAEQAVQIYKQRYWDTVPGIDKLDRASAIVAMDASVNQGPAFARKMIAACGNDAEKMIQYRRQAYDQLVAANPARNEKYAKTWSNRMDSMETDVQKARADETRLASASPANQVYGKDNRTAQPAFSGAAASSTPQTTARNSTPATPADRKPGVAPAVS